MHQQIADATFRIECGGSSGSGFSFRDLNIIATNFHVIKPLVVGGHPVIAITERGQRFSLRLLASSPEDQNDFAIFKSEQEIPPDRCYLSPTLGKDVQRGTQIIFSGFPHGIHDLLVHEAIVSGTAMKGFYIDGSVNGGNSGGPIVACASGEVVGIVTQRRFFGAAQLNALSQEVTQIAQHCKDVADRMTVNIMGLNFGAFANMMAGGFLAVDQILQANANSGIGIGFDIRYLNDELNRLNM